MRRLVLVALMFTVLVVPSTAYLTHTYPMEYEEPHFGHLVGYGQWQFVSSYESGCVRYSTYERQAYYETYNHHYDTYHYFMYEYYSGHWYQQTEQKVIEEVIDNCGIAKDRREGG